MLVRPTIPGHAYCGRFRAPVASPAELVPISWGEWHSWSVFPALNDAWVTEMRKSEAPFGAPLEKQVERQGKVGKWGENGAAMSGERPRGWLPVYWRSLLRPEWVHQISVS